MRLREVDSSSEGSSTSLESELRAVDATTVECNTGSARSRVSEHSNVSSSNARVGTTINGTSTTSSAVILEQAVSNDGASAENEGQSSEG